MREFFGVKTQRKDESGNVKSLDLAEFIVKDLKEYAKKHHGGISLTIKYLNPTYAIRTAPANSAD